MDGREEGRRIGFKGRHTVFRKEPEFGSQLCDLLKSGAALLHIIQLREDIGNDGVTAFGRDFQDVAILNPGAVKHTTRRVELDAVIIDIHVYFTADLGHIAMDQVVHATLENGAVGILREVEAIVGKFEPALGGVGFDEASHHLEQVQQIAAVFGIVDGISLGETVPAGAEHTGLVYIAVVGE